MIEGLISVPWWGYILIVLALTQVTILSVTLYLHRCQAHRALELHPIISHFFRFWLWLTTGMVTKEWAAVHRKHHAKVETQDDPHSPQVMGIKKVLLEGAELYRDGKDSETVRIYGEGTPDDWIERHLYSNWTTLGIFIMLGIDILLFGLIGVTMWAVQMMWIPFFAAGVINGMGHYWGYRNFECKDASRNITPLGILLGGEELHNNHHAFATSAKFSAKWWEIDTGWLVIRTLQFFKLAKAKRILPTPKINLQKNVIDKDTIKAIITYRFQIMATYTNKVILPLLYEEKKRAGRTSKKLFSNARSALTRETSLMKQSQKVRLAALLEHFQSLRVSYQFRLKLQEIWNQRTASNRELLDRLQDWCKQAEATGIETLKQFSRLLKSYVPQEA